MKISKYLVWAFVLVLLFVANKSLVSAHHSDRCSRNCVRWEHRCDKWKHGKCVDWDRECVDYETRCEPDPTSTPLPTETPVSEPTSIPNNTPTSTPTNTPAASPESTGAPQPCNGCGGASVQVCTAAKPSTPSLLNVVRQGSEANISWTASSPVTHYSLSYGTSQKDYAYGVANMGNTTSYTVRSLDPKTTYYFSVRAVNDCMPSDPSTSGAGKVLGSSTSQVLGLASTGSSPVGLVLTLIGASIFPFSIKRKIS